MVFMKRKGFTLIEVLAVIVILGLLIVIIVPVVNSLLKDSEDVLYEEQIDSIINASKKYMVEHYDLLPQGNSYYSISVDDLVSNGVIDNEIVMNPKTKEELDGCVIVSFNDSFNQYEYRYVESSDSLCR